MNESFKKSVFHLFLEKMIFPDREQGAHKMVLEVEATCWRLRECIRLRLLAATHRLERIHRLRMLEEQKAWRREAGFDRIEIVAEMHVQRFHAGFDLEPLYAGLHNPRWVHSPEGQNLVTDVEIERLRLEILPLQPASSPQEGLSPRRSPAVGTALDEPEVPLAEMQST